MTSGLNESEYTRMNRALFDIQVSVFLIYSCLLSPFSKQIQRTKHYVSCDPLPFVLYPSSIKCNLLLLGAFKCNS